MIYIIVPTYGRVDETRKFLSSLEKSIEKKYLVLLIDDHPEKVTFNSIKNNSKIRIFPSEKELWWVGSINLGIEILFNQYVLDDKDIVVFANNDVEINKKCFEKLQNEIISDINQIVHPRTFNQDGLEVSSGAKILNFFPYFSKHPKKFKNKKQLIDMGTARFLMMGGFVLKKVGYINKKLVQYGGDNDFTLSAKRFNGINTYILTDAVCSLNDIETGIKDQNIPSLKKLFHSFFSIKSPNNIKYRYILFKKFFGSIGAFLIAGSLSINTIIKFFFKRIR